MSSFIKILRKSIHTFIKNEKASEAVEMAVLFPILLIMVGFIVDQFLSYDGRTSIAAAGNEAIRAAVVEKTKEEGIEAAEEKLTQQMKSSKLAWCTSKSNRDCKAWGDSINKTDDKETFENDKTKNFLFLVDTGWCDGGYLTLGVRAHKSSVFPSYESFKRLVSSGGTIYHTHTYIITARVESSEECE